MTSPFPQGDNPATTIFLLFAPEKTKTKDTTYSRGGIIREKLEKDKENMAGVMVARVPLTRIPLIEYECVPGTNIDLENLAS